VGKGPCAQCRMQLQTWTYDPIEAEAASSNPAAPIRLQTAFHDFVQRRIEGSRVLESKQCSAGDFLHPSRALWCSHQVLGTGVSQHMRPSDARRDQEYLLVPVISLTGPHGGAYDDAPQLSVNASSATRLFTSPEVGWPQRCTGYSRLACHILWFRGNVRVTSVILFAVESRRRYNDAIRFDIGMQLCSSFGHESDNLIKLGRPCAP
jgi:hypothetical protein